MLDLVVALMVSWVDGEGDGEMAKAKAMMAKAKAKAKAKGKGMARQVRLPFHRCLTTSIG